MFTEQKEEIINTILSMSEEDIIDTINRIYDEYDTDNKEIYEAIWAEEAERRIDSYLKGETETIHGEEVFKKYKINDET